MSYFVFKKLGRQLKRYKPKMRKQYLCVYVYTHIYIFLDKRLNELNFLNEL